MVQVFAMSLSMSSRRRKSFLQLCVMILLFFLSGLAYINHRAAFHDDEPSDSDSFLSVTSAPVPRDPRSLASHAFKPLVQNNHSVAVFDFNGFHDEVHGAVLWTLRQFDGLDIRFYREGWRYGFEEVISKFWDTPPRSPKLFVDDLRNDTSIRHVILTTCDWDWYKVGDGIEAAWKERKDDEKFTLSCVRHFNFVHVAKDLAWAAAKGMLSTVGLGDHVTQSLTRNVKWTMKFLKQWPDARDKVLGLKMMPIRTFIPIFPAETYPEDGDPMFDPRDDNDRTVRTAIIQSTTWDEGHRNLTGIFKDLRRHLEADSVSWGYNPPKDKDIYYTPIPDHPNPFRLYLIGGSRAWLPEEFKWIVHYRVGYSYPHFYGALRSADVVLPAFGTTQYDKDRASSTMGVSGSAPVSILTSQEYSDAYGYFCEDFGIIRTDGMSEIDYIAAIRKGEVEWHTRGERAAALKECQDEWTEKNMLTMAELLHLR